MRCTVWLGCSSVEHWVFIATFPVDSNRLLLLIGYTVVRLHIGSCDSIDQLSLFPPLSTFLARQFCVSCPRWIAETCSLLLCFSPLPSLVAGFHGPEEVVAPANLEGGHHSSSGGSTELKAVAERTGRESGGFAAKPERVMWMV